jgi:kynureninase
MSVLARTDLEQLDRTDPLVHMRDQFDLPRGVIYLDGNSLGPPPRGVAARIARVATQEWGNGLIQSWTDAGWLTLSTSIAEKIAPLVGAEPGSVAVGDSTSINLFKLLGGALAVRPGRRKILSEEANFPTDLYIAEGLIRHLGRGHRLQLVATETIAAAIDDNTAAVMLTHVNYRTGAMHDMAAITAAAHTRDAGILWDLSHSVGAVPVDLAKAGADLAVGCGYKYLNGGPGAPAFLYIAPYLRDSLPLPITGWLGHADPFAFEASYRPAAGITRAVAGTPPILSLAALDAGVDVALQTPIEAIRTKSLQQTELFIRLVEQECGESLRLVTPREAERRGSQVCFEHPHAGAIMQMLVDRGVIGDFRPPDILRFGIAPLYLRYTDLWDAVALISATLSENRFTQKAREKDTKTH